jgi:hypothetical protein
MVYVLNKDGKPLMPTKRHGKVKHLLRSGQAVIVKRTPFTIQLLYEGTGYVQPVVLGVDAGSKTVGLSATTEKEELYRAEATLRTDITKLLSERRQYRRIKRSRLRYRKPRFSNRVRTKQKGWLAPSIRHKVDSHLKLVERVHEILPISKVIIEVASFDIQRIKNPDIKGIEYQKGEQLEFWNVREYVLFRDKHTCQHCKGKSKDKILNVHHIESRKTGGDSPGNLVTLCETCHTAHHEGRITLSVKRGTSFRDAAFMGIMRWACYNRLKELYPNVTLTYGYITKNTRITNGIKKTHAADAYCITGNTSAKRQQECYVQKFVRKSNRSLHKANLLKGGRRKANKAPTLVHGYRLFDKVSFDGRECFLFGRRRSGYFDLRTLDGTVVNRAASFKKLRLQEVSSTLLTERRTQGV